jgi:hypothetical protein
MKKLTAILAASAFLISASAFTPLPDTVSEKIKVAFEKTFAPSSEVSWKKVNDYYLATFKINNQPATAAYNADGQLMSASRSLTLSELPLTVNLALQSQFPEYIFEKMVSEITLEGQSHYYIKAENEKRIVIIKANGDGTLSVESKLKK